MAYDTYGEKMWAYQILAWKPLGDNFEDQCIHGTESLGTVASHGTVVSSLDNR